MTDVSFDRENLAATCRQLAADGLLIGTGGNVSQRRGDTVLITASGIRLGDCTPDDLVEVDLDGAVLEGRFAPTSELALHLDLYRSTPALAVVHTHSPAATAVACSPARFETMPVIHYQQLMLGGDIRIAPYATFGTPELAAHVRVAIEGRQAALLAHHGAVTTGPSLSSAADSALLLEWLAELLLRVAAVTEPVPLSEAQQIDVITQAIERRYGTPKENTP